MPHFRLPLMALGYIATATAVAEAQPRVVSEFAADRVTTSSSIRAASLLAPVAEKAPVVAKNLVANHTLPIDLATALRLANASSPTIAIAQARVREALARVDQADALKLPTVSGGGIYTRHDGIDQNRRGDLFTVTRSGIFLGGSAALRVDLAEAIYQPLVARRLADAEAAAAMAATNNAQLEVVSAYFDLVQAHAQVAINADILQRAEQVLKAAEAGQKAGALRTGADVNRARTEVALRRIERQELSARLATASARLTRLLLLDPAVTLVPLDTAAVPIDLFPATMPLESLIDLAIRNRPELAAAALQQEAAETRLQQAKLSPFIPRVQAEYLRGGFAGALDGSYSDLQDRGDLSAQLFWELRGLGFGNLADIRLRNAERDRLIFVARAARAQVAAEVVEALRASEARRASMDEARTADREANEMFRKLSETSFGMVGPRLQFDALEPLLAIQAMNQARLQYLAAIVEYNRSQFRLLTAVGQAPLTASIEPAPAKELLPAPPEAPVKP